MRVMSTVLALAALSPAPAVACGGFFCGIQQPVYQAGEEVVFAVDGDSVTAHVSIQYEGASDDFAWIVPVTGEPELFASEPELFPTLRGLTNPQYNMVRDTNGMCEIPMPRSDFAVASESFDDGVTVVDEVQVGPYDTVTLQALNEDVLIRWLDDAGYDLPADLAPLLAPYVAENQYFVALKLSAESDTGDLVPLGMRYQGSSASIPIQLTSVAANPDMPVDVYVFGAARAVPDNYLHVTLNDAAIDWFTGGGNYSDVIARAADEAGGQAFATTFSGPTDSLVGELGSDEAARLMRDYPHLTRLTSALDAEEMTVDPVFVINEDLEQDVSNVRSAELKINCAVFEGQSGAERTLVLEDGRRIPLPSTRWLASRDTTEFEVTEELHSPAAILIEDLGAEGLGDVVFDYREEAAVDARRYNRAGCACTTAPSPIGLLGLGLFLPLIVRRRR